MKIKCKIFILILVASMLQSCGGSQIMKQDIGSVVGGLSGALVGSRFGGGSGRLVATGVGALAGAFIGGQLGKNLDEKDKLMMSVTSDKALEYSPTGKSVAWHNPDSGHSGYVVPTRTYSTSNGTYCREVTYVVKIAGKDEKAFGTACRMPDKHWKMQAQ